LPLSSFVSRPATSDAGPRLPEELDRDELATFVLTVMEGAVMQARARGSLKPYDAAIQQLRNYVRQLEAQAAATRPAG